MTFDWTISLGNLLTVAGFGFSGIIFVMMMRGDMLVLASRLNNIEGVLVKLADTAEDMARQEGRIESLNERINTVSRRLDTYIIRPKEG